MPATLPLLLLLPLLLPQLCSPFSSVASFAPPRFPSLLRPPSLPRPPTPLLARGFKPLVYGAPANSSSPALDQSLDQSLASPPSGASGSPLSPADRTRLWEQAYKQHLGRVGRQLTALAHRGHAKSGRGAVLSRGGPRATPSATPLEAQPSAYLPRADWQAKAATAPEDADNLSSILARIDEYDPSEQFVIVFEAHGVMGADVVRPSVSPGETARELEREEREGGVEGGVVDVDYEE